VANNSPGRKANAAQPLGERQGTASKADVAKAGLKERKSAGPDGPDAKAIGDTFKK
jgi:hypothetical protein